MDTLEKAPAVPLREVPVDLPPRPEGNPFEDLFDDTFDIYFDALEGIVAETLEEGAAGVLVAHTDARGNLFEHLVTPSRETAGTWRVSSLVCGVPTGHAERHSMGEVLEELRGGLGAGCSVRAFV